MAPPRRPCRGPSAAAGWWALLAVAALLLPRASTGPFLQAAEWAEKSRLNAEDTLPLTADVTFDVGVRGGGGSPQLAGRGSYIADFGLLDVPHLGEVRARAGLRYSRLYPRGALELGVRKELRSDPKRGYELFLGAQSAGDDRRLDVLADVGALKHFKNARAFYRFLWGVGWPFGDREQQEGPGWNEMGSSLGVTQQGLAPGGRGELTVGWRTGLFDNGLEGVDRPASPDPEREAKETRNRAAKKGKKQPEGLLNSTPYAAYSVKTSLPGKESWSATASWTVLPQHDTLEHSLRFSMPRDSSGGDASVSAVLDQSLRHPSRLRLRLGASYTRD